MCLIKWKEKWLFTSESLLLCGIFILMHVQLFHFWLRLCTWTPYPWEITNHSRTLIRFLLISVSVLGTIIASHSALTAIFARDVAAKRPMSFYIPCHKNLILSEFAAYGPLRLNANTLLLNPMLPCRGLLAAPISCSFHHHATPLRPSNKITSHLRQISRAALSNALGFCFERARPLTRCRLEHCWPRALPILN